MSLIAQIRLLMRELRDYQRLFDPSNRRLRTVVFFSERDIYYQYFEKLVDYLLAHSSIDICYLSSDPADPLFGTAPSRLRPFYLNHLIPSAISRLDGKVLVMTMPELHQFRVKRSRSRLHHVYLFHAVVSTHLQYRLGSFDHYDTVFCVGPHHVREIRRTEELYGLPRKHLLESGYHRLEKIFEDHRRYLEARVEQSPRRPFVVVAPTWGDASILQTCVGDLLTTLAQVPCDVSVRPHPEFVRRQPELLQSITQAARRTPNIRVETDLVSDLSLHQADVLITDRSGIAYEYAFGTERPVLFIDTPLKVQNPEYRKLELEPIEISSRAAIGVSVAMDEIPRLPAVMFDLIRHRESYRQKILECRATHLFNWGKSAEVEGQYILGLLETTP